MGKLILSRRRLFELVWAKPMTDLAHRFGVRAKHLARACDQYDIPRPRPGHWQKLAFGKPLPEARLSADSFAFTRLIAIDVDDHPHAEHRSDKAA